MRPVVYKTNIFCAHMSTWQTRVRPMFQYDASRSEMRVMKRKTAYVSGCHDTWATITTNNTTDRHVSGLLVILSDTSLPYTLRVMPVWHVTSTFSWHVHHIHDISLLDRYVSVMSRHVSGFLYVIIVFADMWQVVTTCIGHVTTCIGFFVCHNLFLQTCERLARHVSVMSRYVSHHTDMCLSNFILTTLYPDTYLYGTIYIVQRQIHVVPTSHMSAKKDYDIQKTRYMSWHDRYMSWQRLTCLQKYFV
jgi:hypothetical protein